MAASLSEAVAALRRGQIIAYPTEAVYGLGCDPRNRDALRQLLGLKVRPEDKGLILAAASLEQVRPFLAEDLDPALLAKAEATWPGPVTWVIACHKDLPDLLTGQRATLAVRVSAHPTLQALCQAFGPLVSTSCNLSGHPPARSVEQVREAFGPEQVPVLIDAPLGGLLQPTHIFDLQTGRKLR